MTMRLGISRGWALAAALVLLTFAAPAQAQLNDFGDAPDPTFPSLLASSGPRHSNLTDCFVGWASNGELDALVPNMDADDGSPLLYANHANGMWTAWIYVPITIAPMADPLQPRYLNVLFDGNQSGTWCDVGGEWTVRDYQLPKYGAVHNPGQTVWYCIGGFSWVTNYSGLHWIRVSVTDVPVSATGLVGPLGWTGVGIQFAKGETEDWLLSWFYNPPKPPDPPNPPPHDPQDPNPPAPIPSCNKTVSVYQTPPPTHRGHSGGFGVTVENTSADHPIHIVAGPFVTGPSGSPINIEIEPLYSTVIQPGGKVTTPGTWSFPNPAPNSSSCDFDVVVDPQGQYVVAANVGNYTSPNSTNTTGGSFLDTPVPAIGGIALAVLVVGVGLTALYFIVRRRRATANN
jgi:hypothetical protein